MYTHACMRTNATTHWHTCTPANAFRNSHKRKQYLCELQLPAVETPLVDHAYIPRLIAYYHVQDQVKACITIHTQAQAQTRKYSDAHRHRHRHRHTDTHTHPHAHAHAHAHAHTHTHTHTYTISHHRTR